MNWHTVKAKKESSKFDEAAVFYDLYRPSYPSEMIDRIIDETGIDVTDPLIEVGAGSGKATELFVDRGYSVTCVGLGENLARVGREKFRDTGKVTYVVGRFEEIDDLPVNNRLAFSAQAFHWVPKPDGYHRMAEVLGMDGYCALMWNRYFDDESPDTRKFNEICRAYGLMPLADKSAIMKMKEQEIEAIKQSGVFKDISYYEYPWEEEQNYETFMNFLMTANSYIGMDQKIREDLHKKLSTAFEQAGGTVARRYVGALFLMKKA